MEQHRHFRIETAPSAERYQYTGEPRGPALNIPTRDDRPGRGAKLRQDIQNAVQDAAQTGQPQERDGITLEFTGEPDYDLVFDSLDPRASQGIELSNVRRTPREVAATVYVPPGKVDYFFRMLDRCSEATPDGVKAPRGQRLIDSIASIRRAAVRAFWTDTYAANLARCDEVAVYPVGGWWKERKHLGMFNRRTRYALVISIETPEVTAQLYSAIANQITVQSQIAT